MYIFIYPSALSYNYASLNSIKFGYIKDIVVDNLVLCLQMNKIWNKSLWYTEEVTWRHGSPWSRMTKQSLELQSVIRRMRARIRVFRFGQVILELQYKQVGGKEMTLDVLETEIKIDYTSEKYLA